MGLCKGRQEKMSGPGERQGCGKMKKEVMENTESRIRKGENTMRISRRRQDIMFRSRRARPERGKMTRG